MDAEEVVRQLKHINLKLALIIEPKEGIATNLQKILSQLTFIQEEIENILHLLNNHEDVLIRF